MISIESVASGNVYQIGTLCSGALQYADRAYRFAYIPEDLQGCPFIQTHGSDKMLDEDTPCFTVHTDCAYEVYILYPDNSRSFPHGLPHMSACV